MNYSIFAHNYVPVLGSFDVLSDTYVPTVTLGGFLPIRPTVTDKITFTATFEDDGVGVCCGYLVLSSTEFENYTLHEFTQLNQTQQYRVELPLLDYGTYQYGIVVYDFMDHGNSTFDTDTNLSFKIQVPIQLYLLSFMNIAVVLIGIAAFVFINLQGKRKKSSIETMELSFDEILSDHFMTRIDQLSIPE